MSEVTFEQVMEVATDFYGSDSTLEITLKNNMAKAMFELLDTHKPPTPKPDLVELPYSKGKTFFVSPTDIALIGKHGKNGEWTYFIRKGDGEEECMYKVELTVEETLSRLGLRIKRLND